MTERETSQPKVGEDTRKMVYVCHCPYPSPDCLRNWRRPLHVEAISAPQGELHLIKSRCKGCGFCIEFCPRGALEVSEELSEKGYHPPKIKDYTKCSLCGLCELVCPDLAIFKVEWKLPVSASAGINNIRSLSLEDSYASKSSGRALTK